MLDKGAVKHELFKNPESTASVAWTFPAICCYDSLTLFGNLKNQRHLTTNWNLESVVDSVRSVALEREVVLWIGGFRILKKT
jgi:hypothetical protein